MNELIRLFESLSNRQKTNLNNLFKPPFDQSKSAEKKTLGVSSINGKSFLYKQKALFSESVGSLIEEDLPIRIIKFENAIVTQSGFVIVENEFVYDTNWIWPEWFKGFGVSGLPYRLNRNGIFGYDPFTQTIQYWQTAKIKKINQPMFLFNADWGKENFAHFIFDTMLQVPSFLELKTRIRDLIPYFTGTHFKFDIMNFLFEAATQLDTKNDCFWNKGIVYQVKELYVPTLHADFAQSRLSTVAVRRMRRLLLQIGSLIPSEPCLDIYITRTDSQRKKLDPAAEGYIGNQEMLTNFLSKRNFKFVEASGLPLGEYLKTFKNSNILVGAHGAGLLNAFFSKNPKVVEFLIPGATDWNVFELLFNAANIEHRKIYAGEKNQNLNLQDLEKILTDLRE